MQLGQKIWLNYSPYEKIFLVNDPVTRVEIDRVRGIWLEDCNMRVDHYMRYQVLNTRRRQSHAYIEGYIGAPLDPALRGVGEQISYYPYFADYFFFVSDKTPVIRADHIYAYVCNDRAYVYGYGAS